MTVALGPSWIVSHAADRTHAEGIAPTKKCFCAFFALETFDISSHDELWKGTLKVPIQATP